MCIHNYRSPLRKGWQVVPSGTFHIATSSPARRLLDRGVCHFVPSNSLAISGVAAAFVAGNAFEVWPESNGGCSRIRWTVGWRFLLSAIRRHVVYVTHPTNQDSCGSAERGKS